MTGQKEGIQACTPLFLSQACSKLCHEVIDVDGCRPAHVDVQALIMEGPLVKTCCKIVHPVAKCFGAAEGDEEDPVLVLFGALQKPSGDHAAHAYRVPRTRLKAFTMLVLDPDLALVNLEELRQRALDLVDPFGSPCCQCGQDELQNSHGGTICCKGTSQQECSRSKLLLRRWQTK